ncbi:MAG: thiamine-phosphate kinase [Methanocella sp.]
MPGEFEIIERYFTYPASGAVLGVGDDAALLRAEPGMEVAISTDMLVCGRHFFPDADPRRLGHKTLAVNLSDMAAMGATPRWATLSLALPRIDTTWLKAFMSGFMRLARRHGTDLVGGDTTRGPLTLCVQIMGVVPAGRALRRDGAHAGDDVWISGTLGEAALAVAAARGTLRLSPEDRKRVQRRLDLPVPRIALGVALRGIARAAIDVSDGLVADLAHICERSRLAAEIELERVPVSSLMKRSVDARLARNAILTGGDDYELCFTAPASSRAEVERAARSVRVPVARIGAMKKPGRDGTRVTVTSNGRPLKLARAGYDHFG